MDGSVEYSVGLGFYSGRTFVIFCDMAEWNRSDILFSFSHSIMRTSGIIDQVVCLTDQFEIRWC
jgi:hypothetical protein